MKYYMDIHIHSVLSPCADFLMTMENIFEKLKENNIKIFSITDHNSAKNSKQFYKRALKEGILCIPGMEIQTSEEIHILTYFKTMEILEKFSETVYKNLPPIKNNEEIYGYQLILDENDEYSEKEEAFLAGASNIGIDELAIIVKEMDGILIPAHIDRSNSIISNLGYIPDIDFDGFEVYKPDNIESIKKKYNINKNILSSSDAHFKDMILKPKMSIELEKLDVIEFFEALKNKKVNIEV